MLAKHHWTPPAPDFTQIINRVSTVHSPLSSLMPAAYFALMLRVIKLLRRITEGRVITQPTGKTHTIRLISVYIPSLASEHDRGEPRVRLISCRPSFLYKHSKLFIAASAESILSCFCLNTVCMCVFSIFSYRSADVLGFAGKEVLGHRQAGDRRTHSHTQWLMSFLGTLH